MTDKLESVLYEKSPRILPRPKDNLGMMAWTWSTGFGLGILRPAPGTWGSLLGFGAFWTVVSILSLSGGSGLSRFFSVLIVMGTMAASLILGALLEERIRCGDHSSIISDEVTGVIITFQPIVWMLPMRDQIQSFWLWSLGFVLFRFFDAIKPFPINLLDRLSKVLSKKGAHPFAVSLAVQIDDWVAGVASAVVLGYVIRLTY